MKTHYLLVLAGLLVFSSCKNETQSKDQTSEPIENEAEKTETATATFISETLDLIHCESAVYDKNTNYVYASQIGNSEPGDGAIARLNVDGSVDKIDFVGGLKDPKGIAITNDRIYVSDVTVLVEADKATGEVLNRHTADSTKFLNDVAISPSGDIFVSDTRTSVIYKLDKAGTFESWLDDAALDHPNGLLVLDNTMYVACWGGGEAGGRILKIDMATKAIAQVTAEPVGNMDGIRPYDANHLLISDWQSGKVYKMSLEGDLEEVVQVGQSVGDIAYVPEKDLLLLPMNRQSRLLFYSLK